MQKFHKHAHWVAHTETPTPSIQVEQQEILPNPVEVSVNQLESPISLWTAIAAAIIALLALTWNIVREFIVDRPRLNVGVDIGTMRPVKDIPNKPVFTSLEAYDKRPPIPIHFLFTITNTGRQPIVVSKICAKYTKHHKKKHPESKSHWVLVTRGLPTTLKPYENHSELAEPSEIVRDILADSYDYFFVSDTKGKGWRVSKKSMRKIRKVLQDKRLFL